MATTRPSDSIDTRIPASCPAPISQILYHSWHHDLTGLKPLLTVPESARVQEPTTGESPLHAAIRACAPANQGELGGDAADVEEHAKAVVHELFMSGGIWNGLDDNDETPGCVAERLGLKGLYTLCVEAGVRAELLFGLLDGYEELESDDGEDEEEDGSNKEDDGEEEVDTTGSDAEAVSGDGVEAEQHVFVSKRAQGPNVNSEDYLRSNLTYSDGKLVDSAQNGVMMAWETSIMRASVDSLLPELPAGRKVLNIGFGMGIIDSMFAETKPSKHHIIEAHPAVLEHINGSDSKFGKDWEASGASDGAYKVHAGKWQDVLPKLLEQGETYDAIYFDTFGEDYNQLRLFFTEYVPGLLEDEGRFGFFNGLGADRKICYDVYTQVVEMHLSDAGMDVEWQVLDVDMKDLEKEGEGEWKDVKRRYWTLDSKPTDAFFLTSTILIAS
ncbi:arginine N-methyltransferase 2 [Annulohypoxylon maeteangense]|uniref:arginine N-methyltransferase 2 n=1 Tax=Annulohypoxylon maeteangense TaxID=1927788 RepID=UPI002008559E|nr:arginine N-methyltransferase 2 [Annulohypoxylon maeteangense]KAI0889671.1 arginine N-methyltransferase 2 [Annulohypoxylon maeteangense]